MSRGKFLTGILLLILTAAVAIWPAKRFGTLGTAAIPGPEVGMIGEPKKEAAVQPQPETGPDPMKLYGDFLKSQEMYGLTATFRCPRGDSQATYGFGDCNGDGIPELHLDSQEKYRIYIVRDGEVQLFSEMEYGTYMQIVPLKNGGFVEFNRFERGDESMGALQRIPKEIGTPGEALLPEGILDQYEFFRLDTDGTVLSAARRRFSVSSGKDFDRDENIYRVDGEECTKQQWQMEASSYLTPLEDASLLIPMEYVFSEEERSYLDAMEEGNGIPAPEGVGEEWQAYERILSGDFSAIDMERRGHLRVRYWDNLDKDSGRSGWHYILMDFDEDGTQELFIQCEPLGFTGESEDSPGGEYFIDVPGVERFIDNTICFTYRDGKPVLLWSDATGYHDYIVPLRDGSLLSLKDYAYVPGLSVNRVGAGWEYLPSEKEYTNLIVDYGGTWDASVYEGLLESYGVTGEGSYYFEETGGMELKRMTEQEWSEMEQTLRDRMIPMEDWRPAAVFLPDRRLEFFFAG